MDLYFAGIIADAITLLNFLGVSILYNVFLKKLRNIKALRAEFICEQSFNCKLVCHDLSALAAAGL